ncbi:PREDICTED: ER membrane protein complex subunit 4 [Nicrophorus vespilloides]|uniref:ER membrane protein complex subunit 4 n=1 Tax=Nicrophorus vespilloides TaxID=110193 RepID=A0ABM1M5I3_NICVS|nr:PREDICTED: ER membrane protein complex subunit 4 [Nicrophorus vespilloides]XP_017769832.1 PREDICTED: ER membrane protein complex subunit 4 [Nicrophorus vespilloides]XP_017769833.1 PREDICTED: ER membrane protein complex subunit 4 [Nicrophorus vespilloides]
MSSNKNMSRRMKWSLESSKSNRVAISGGDLACPPAYSTSSSISNSEVTKKTDTSHLIKKKSWELALAPLKQVPMNLFIMYMAGNSISIFPIMMVGMLCMRPIQALFSINSTFKLVEDSSAAAQKLVYLLGNFINIGLALYKCQSMGLLPTHSSDWLAFVEPQTRQEYLGGGIMLS